MRLRAKHGSFLRTFPIATIVRRGRCWPAASVAGGICAGPTDTQGRATGLSVDLRFHSGRTSTGKIYVFSVFNNFSCDTERVYQLAVNQVRRQLKAVHQFSHEHVGDLRTLGTPDWTKWSYHQVLAYFCAQTNIVFRPPPPQPFQPFRRKR